MRGKEKAEMGIQGEIERKTINLDAITLQDCIDAYEKKGIVFECYDGKISNYYVEY